MGWPCAAGPSKGDDHGPHILEVASLAPCEVLANLLTLCGMRDTRKISWIKAARRDFEEFPKDVQSDMLDALTVAAEGRKSEKA